nr:RNA-binding S4 domain-containing protein [Microbacterium mitrae]
MVSSEIPEVDVDGDMIRLGQFLKYASLVDTGGDAKAVLADGLVFVNGEVETRRGRQLHDGDIVDVAESAIARVRLRG